jgi:hypothetical protein
MFNIELIQINIFFKIYNANNYKNYIINIILL